MTRIIIEDVENTADVLNALSVVTRAFSDPAAFQAESHTFSKGAPRGEESDQSDADEPDQPDAEDLNQPDAEPRAVPYVPCSKRGTHLRLTDCWMCWSDVRRGAAVESEVLIDGWDAALARLVREGHR